MSEYLTAKEINDKSVAAENDFNYKTKLQIIHHITKRTKDGKNLPYLIITFSDVTGMVLNIKKWSNNEHQYNHELNIFEPGNILELNCRFNKMYNSSQIENFKLLNEEAFLIENFIKSPNINAESLMNEIFDKISKIQNQFLKKLLKTIFADNLLKQKYMVWPSAIKIHHNYKSGNLQHTVSMIKIFERMVNFYKEEPNLNIDLIYSGIILHDIGKLGEYSVNNQIYKKTPKGNLLGHLYLGAELISNYIEKIEDFPEDLKDKIKHMIISHHGKKEWGAIKEPQFPEAEILHNLDMIDSRYKMNPLDVIKSK